MERRELETGFTAVCCAQLVRPAKSLWRSEMPNAVRPIPEQYRSLTPNLVCRNAVAAIDFYKKVFGATEVERFSGPEGKIMHAELKIGDSIIFVNDLMMGQLAPAALPGATNPTYLHLYVP